MWRPRHGDDEVTVLGGGPVTPPASACSDTPRIVTMGNMTKNPTSPRSRRRRRSRFEAHRGERREELLDTATDVVRRLGADTTMEAIAAEVGVAKPVLYRYFGNRSGLFDALSNRFGTRLVETMAAALGRDLPARERLVAGIDAYVGILEADPQLYRFVTTRVQSDAARIGSVLDQATVLLARVLSDELRTAGRDSGPAEIWAGGIVGMVHVAADRWLARPMQSRSTTVEQLSELLWSGLGAVVAATAPAVAEEVVA